jgi:hypothetical protein
VVRFTLFILLTFTSLAHAQRNPGSAWLSLDYTYTNLTYKEPALTDMGNLAGVRGELGIGLSSTLGLSVGGEYQDGNLNYDGATLTGAQIQQVSKDWMHDLRGLLHVFMGPLVLSGGIGQREWYENLVVAYRRREVYNYYPMALTFYQQAVYIRLEYDLWKNGTNKSYMSDSGANDVLFHQGGGSGYGLEIGYLIPTAIKFFNRVYLSYHRWDVSDSDAQSDGVASLTQPKNNTVTIQGGLGFSF